jgi:PII-like signaling protein
VTEHDCLTLTGYFGERRRADGKPAAEAFLDQCEQHGVTTAILLRAIQGFGHSRRLRTDRSLTLSEDLPLVAVALDTRPRGEAALEQAAALAEAGLVTLQRTQLLTGDRRARLPLADDAEDADDARMSVFCTSHDRVFSVPAAEAICDLLRRRGVTSAAAFAGVDGFLGGRRLHARFLGRHAEVPVMILATGDRDRVLAVTPEVAGLLRHPLMTVEPVRTCKREGAFLAVPDRSPGSEHDQPRWQKLSVCAPDSAQHDGQALHRVLLRRLLAAGASGATTLRGVHGFDGDGSPPGPDGRRAARGRPAVTVVLDTADRIPAAFAVIDEVTAARGLVTSELIAVRPAAAGLPGRRP